MSDCGEQATNRQHLPRLPDTECTQRALHPATQITYHRAATQPGVETATSEHKSDGTEAAATAVTTPAVRWGRAGATGGPQAAKGKRTDAAEQHRVPPCKTLPQTTPMVCYAWGFAGGGGTIPLDGGTRRTPATPPLFPRLRGRGQAPCHHKWTSAPTPPSPPGGGDYGDAMGQEHPQRAQDKRDGDCRCSCRRTSSTLGAGRDY